MGISNHVPVRSEIEPIALVGVGCRLPGDVSTVEELLGVFLSGKDCVTEIPRDRWNVEWFYDEDPLTPGKTYVRHGGFVPNIDRFDAAFFGISDAEAARMDPQQRILLETVWHALEHAGQSAEDLSKSNTGVFLAMMNTNGYSQLKTHFEGINGVTGYDAMGDAMSITAGRISHFLGLDGPCLALDTACSGSMVAMHLARQSILSGECDAAIVAGVGLMLNPSVHIAFSKLGLMSPSGRCRAFDASADGYIRGEGCVAVILRRESLALMRGDRIVASIIGSAVNQDGNTPALTAPNGIAQEKVIRTALARLGVSPNEIGYVEAHGTGTPVGDPIEMNALANVYGPGRSDQQPLYVGSAKTNFGHIEPGAGLLGIVKAALSLQHGSIFPSLHFNQLNPGIEIGRAPITVPTECIAWKQSEQPRMAGVNSFGYSGTNAHVVLREAPPISLDVHTVTARPSEIVLLSAKSAASLHDLAVRYIDYLQEDSAATLKDIAFTSATGRSHLRHRIAIVAGTKDEVREKLTIWEAGRTGGGLVAGQVSRRKSKLAMVFTGQGSQYAGMGRQLYDSEPRYRSTVDRCAEIMDAVLDVPLLEILFGERSKELLSHTRYVQPALFALEYGLADLLRYWGIEPDFVVGHSAGEVVAACIAGMFDLESAAKYVVARGRIMGQLPREGKMLAINATQEEAIEWLRGKEGDASLAAVNGPNRVVVSGRDEAIDEIAKLASAAGRGAMQLEVSHAFHSPILDPILEEHRTVAMAIDTRPARIPIALNVPGTLTEGSIDPNQWISGIRSPVLFYQCIRSIVEAGCTMFIEVGPHPALTQAIASGFESAKSRCFTTMQRDGKDIQNVLRGLASLHVAGVPIVWEHVFWNKVYQRATLPQYPFRQDRHWIEGDASRYNPADLKAAVTDVELPTPEIKAELHPLLGRATNVTGRKVDFETTLSVKRPWADHRVLGSTLVPASAFLEMAARGFSALHGQDWTTVTLKNVSFERPLVLIYGKPKTVRLTLENFSQHANAEATFTVSVAGGDNGKLETFCRGRIELLAGEPQHVSLDAELARREVAMHIGGFYGELRNGGLEYGASFATVRELWKGAPGSGEAIGRVAATPFEETSAEHPFVSTVQLDGCFHVCGGALDTLSDGRSQGAFVPVTIASVVLRSELPQNLWSYANVRTGGKGHGVLASIRAFSPSGDVIVEIEGLELRKTSTIGVAREGAAGGNGKSAADAIFTSREHLTQQLTPLDQRARVGFIAKWLSAEVKDVMGQAAEELDLDNLDPSAVFLEIGLDSLLVTELQRRIQEKLQFRFQAMQGLDYQSIESLAEYILKDVLALEPAKREPQTAEAAAAY